MMEKAGPPTTTEAPPPDAARQMSVSSLAWARYQPDSPQKESTLSMLRRDRPTQSGAKSLMARSRATVSRPEERKSNWRTSCPAETRALATTAMPRG